MNESEVKTMGTKRNMVDTETQEGTELKDELLERRKEECLVRFEEEERRR
jgi:hypothetical protein